MKQFGIIALIALCVMGCKPDPKEEPQQPQPVQFDTPTWQVKSGTDYATMTLIMAMPDSVVCDTTDIIGVFTNDDSECLAVSHPVRINESLLLGFVTIVAPTAQNNCYLKYYHKATKYMYTTPSSALVYDTDARVGTLNEPKTFVWNIIKK